MDKKIIEGLKLIKVYCGGSENCFYQMNWVLTGNAKKSVRKHILEVLTGEKVLAKDTGITRMNNILYDAIKPDGDCIRSREIDFQKKASQLIA